MGDARRERALEAAADVGAVLLAWAVALLVESIVLAVVWGDEFSAAWEIAKVRRLLLPLACAALAPAAVAAAGWVRVAERAGQGARPARAAMAALGALGAGAVGVGVTHGRHFASLTVRGPAVALLVVAGAAAAVVAAPRLAAARRPSIVAGGGMLLAALCWLADARVLPRLYPAFHEAIFVGCLASLALAAIGARTGAGLGRAGRLIVALGAGAIAVGCALLAPRSARSLSRLSNVRRVVVDHAPLLGRAVELATRLAPPEDLPAAPARAVSAPGEVARSLDWTGQDLVLLSVDALRADHVSAYGYGRPTTPNLDALAREGTLFEAAFCPTPHTSYSVTSMMTGKYLRPLLALGLGEDSETWAQDLRLYGWRTAAFYPPAVFFIDEDRFPRFEQEHLGFEYAKVEFADSELRERQVAGYLDGALPGKPLFLWVHLFEPHEPYVAHPDHPFAGGPSPDVDAYDSEIAAADDGIGRIVRLLRARRPGAVVIATADHGEEFGEHGGRYHGTTVFEEQVRVPLVVAGPGVGAGARVRSVVQTIDLLPTALSALGVPRPARLRGRDLGPLLSGRGDEGPGFAFAETDDYALVASGADRLVCERRAAACALYEPATDPGERVDRAADRPAAFAFLRTALRDLERDQGHFEASAGPAWPEAIRRGMVGDPDVAVDVASLLDDADVRIRRKAAEVCCALHAPATLAQARRAFARDEDDEVRRWAALTLVRLGDAASPLAVSLLRDPSEAWRRRAALAFGERSDPRACDVLAAWWEEAAPARHEVTADGEPPRLAGLDLAHAQELLAATGLARCRAAVPALARALDDVRARPYVADALGALGDDRARAPLLALLAADPYVTSRPHEAAALLALGARDWSAKAPAAHVAVKLAAPRGPLRAVVLLSDAAGTLQAEADGRALPAEGEGRVRWLAVGAHAPAVALDLTTSPGGIQAVWLVPSAAAD